MSNKNLDVTSVATIAMYFAMGAIGVVNANATDLEEVGGEIGLMTDLAGMAEFAQEHIESVPGREYPGVLEYEVCRGYGAFYVENLHSTAEHKRAELIRQIDEFFAR